MTKNLNHLYADVACVEVGEDEHVGTASHLTGLLDLVRGHGRDNGSIKLELAIALDVRAQLVDALHGLADDVDALVTGRALGGEGQQGHARLPAKQGGRRVGRGNGNAREFLGRGLGRDGAVRQPQHGALRAVKARDVGNAQAGGGSHALGQPHDAHGRLDDVARRALLAGRHAVHATELEQEHGAQQRVLCAARARLAAEVVKAREVLVNQGLNGRLVGIVKALKGELRCAGAGGKGLDLGLVANEDGRTQPLGVNPLRQSHHVRTCGLRQADPLGRFLSLLDDAGEEVVRHGCFPSTWVSRRQKPAKSKVRSRAVRSQSSGGACVLEWRYIMAPVVAPGVKLVREELSSLASICT